MVQLGVGPLQQRFSGDHINAVVIKHADVVARGEREIEKAGRANTDPKRTAAQGRGFHELTGEGSHDEQARQEKDYGVAVVGFMQAGQEVGRGDIEK